MDIVLDGKKLKGGFLDGKILKKVYVGNKQVWGDVPPVQFDSFSKSDVDFGSTEWTHTATEGSWVIVTVPFSAGTTISSVTYDGESMTPAGVVHHNNVASNGGMARFQLADVPGGPKTVAITMTSIVWCCGLAASYLNVDSVLTSTTAYGSGSTMSQGPVPVVPSGSRAIHAFSEGAGGGPVGTLIPAGGTVLGGYLSTVGGSGFAAVLQDSNKTATFSASTSSASPWAGISTVLKPKPSILGNSTTRTLLAELTHNSVLVVADGVPTDFGDIVGYNFYRNNVKANGSVVTTTEYTFTGLSPNTPYTLSCAAVDATGLESARYASVTVTTPTDPALPIVDRNAIDTIVNEAMTDLGQPGVMVHVKCPKGEYIKTYGFANIAKTRPISLNDHFRIGSNTKTFTGNLVLMEIDKGNLALTDILEDFIPGVPNGTQITVEHMLSMRSGVFDYPTEQGTAIMHYLFPTTPFTADQAIGIIKSKPAMFAPGTDYQYTNSNYVLLGRILETITGRSIKTMMLEDLLVPLGMSETSWPPDAWLPTPYAEGLQADVLFGGWRDGTLTHPGLFDAAGALVSNMADLMKWAKELRDGTLLSPELHQLRETQYWYHHYGLDHGPEEYGYGLGYYKISEWMGHAGSVPGYTSTCFYHPPTGSIIIGIENMQTAEASMMSRIMHRIAHHLYPDTMEYNPPP